MHGAVSPFFFVSWFGKERVRRMRGMKKLMALAIAAALSGPLRADQVYFKNGDHLTGKIEGLADGKLSITSAVAGKINVNLKDVKTFSTDGPITLQLKDGTVIHQRVLAAPEGQFTAAPGGAIAKHSFQIAQIAKVNPVSSWWTGHVVIGGFLARGNTDADSLNASAHAVRTTDTDRLTLDAGYLYARQKPAGGGPKTRTEDNWFVEGSYDRFFSKKFYGYVNARVERDLIADLSLRFTPGIGAGYQWFDNPNDFSFNTEGGASWLYRDYSNDGSDENAAIRLAYHLKKKFNSQVAAFHDFEYFPGVDSISDFYFNTDAGIHVALTSQLFTEFKIEYRHDEKPAPRAQKDDVRYTVGVGWNF
jgi:putative salt-induced outer membrane protein YdiY